MTEPDTLPSQPWDDLARMPRPSSFELGEYVLGLLPPAAASRVKAFLDAHPHTAAEVALLQTYLYQDEPTSQAVPGPLTRLKVLAMQMLDATGPQGAWIGARGAVTAIVYQADDWQVILDSDADPAHPGRFILTGLVLGPETPAPATATLLSAHTPTFTAASDLDEFGNFTILNLIPGQYDLVVLAPQQATELHVAGITLGPVRNP